MSKNMQNIPDQEQRNRALDVTQSFIVQAPAGSGKTELLTNRFIRLLNTVKNPEEIIAITFTRKAAAEMRHRIISKMPSLNPKRLRIMTIDAFCGFLVAQMPLKSKLGEDFQIVENADLLYEKAIENLFLNHHDKYLEEFLLYLDNDVNRVNNLCTEILKNRDQWLPHIFKWKNPTDFMKALAHTLKLLVAELEIIFNTESKYDFVEIALRAQEALGDEENPTDLALKLDYQIKHLLIDEFQDTSTTQWRLLKKITAGWEPQDGRTLFLVGDPMQSIYRFRKAEVGLFYEVQKHGINQISLETIVLSTNFRSDKKIVDWVNQCFSTSSTAVHDDEINQSVFYWPGNGNIVEIIKQHAGEKIAILVRAKSHIRDIIPELQKHQISFRAVEMTNLSDHWLVQDLLSLTRALLDFNDRIAWLAILRAPWCGLSLKDFDELFSQDFNKNIWELLLASHTENKRLVNFIKAIQWAIKHRDSLPLREWVEKTWHKLKGDYCLTQEAEYKIAYQYFDLLDQYQHISEIEKQLYTLSLPMDKTRHVDVEIMTIHKAKGLEFDVVILPALERYTRPDSSKLFLWEEKLNQNGEMDLLVGPIHTEIYDFLRKEENKKDDEELQRLFYVACTRAKKYLHLVFSVNFKNPAKKSFLNILWPLISDQVEPKGREIKKQKDILLLNAKLKRLPSVIFE